MTALAEALGRAKRQSETEIHYGAGVRYALCGFVGGLESNSARDVTCKKCAKMVKRTGRG